MRHEEAVGNESVPDTRKKSALHLAHTFRSSATTNVCTWDKCARVFGGHTLDRARFHPSARSVGRHHLPFLLPPHVAPTWVGLSIGSEVGASVCCDAGLHVLWARPTAILAAN